VQLRIWIGHVLFNVGFWTFFWGAFELAYQSGSSPIWSGTFGPPIPHHYIVGAIVAYAGYVVMSINESIRTRLRHPFRRK
jgi:hypothetical protein